MANLNQMFELTPFEPSKLNLIEMTKEVKQIQYERGLTPIKSNVNGLNQFITKAAAKWKEELQSDTKNFIDILSRGYMIMPYLKAAFEEGYKRQVDKEIQKYNMKEAEIKKTKMLNLLHTRLYGFLVSDISYIAIPESEFKVSSISPAGAVGIYQFMPRTWQSFAPPSFEESFYRFDPIISAQAAGAYFANLLLNLSYDPLLAISAYNGGLSRIKNAKTYKEFFENYISKHAKSNDRPNGFDENVRYVPKFIGTMAAFSDSNIFVKNPALKQYEDFCHLPPKEFSILTSSNKYPIYKVKKGDTLTSIAKRHGVSLEKLKEVNGIHRSGGDKINTGMELRIPKEFNFKAEAFNLLSTQATKNKWSKDDVNLILMLNELQIQAAYSSGALNLIIPKDLKGIKPFNNSPLQSEKQPAIQPKDTRPKHKPYPPSKKFPVTLEFRKEPSLKYIASNDTTIVFHPVKPGQTLFSIAINYGVNINDILKWNNKKIDNIRVGEIIHIKLKGKWVEAGAVKPGESYNQLKSRFKSDIFVLGSSVNVIQPGEKIYRKVP